MVTVQREPTLDDLNSSGLGKRLKRETDGQATREHDRRISYRDLLPVTSHPNALPTTLLQPYYTILLLPTLLPTTTTTTTNNKIHK